MGTTALPGTSVQAQAQPGKARELARAEMRMYIISLILLDLALTFVAFQLSYQIRFASGIGFFRDSIIPKVPFYIDVMLLAIPFWVAIFAITGLYNPQNLLGGTREYSLAFNATTLGMFLIISVGFLFPDELILARGWVVLAWLLDFVMIATGRFFARRIIYMLRKQGHFQHTAVIVGGNDEAAMLAEQFLNNKTSGVRIVGYVDNERQAALDAKTKWLGSITDLDSIIARHGVMDLILSSSALTQQEVLALFRQFGTMKDINLRLSSGLYEIITTGMEVKEDGSVPLVTVNKVRMTGSDQALKILLDYCIAIAVLTLALPLFAVIAVAIKLDTPGPVIYRRRVMGVNGRQFDAFKFRTMRLNSDRLILNNPALRKEYEVSFKLKNDPRVTRVGKLLRRTSLDELPQLFNILRNEMSIVGPRMISPAELDRYDQWDINLMTVKPGLTGLWQVRGRSDVSYEERVRMDMYYIRNWTIWLDLQLLMQTIPAVLSRRGAY